MLTTELAAGEHLRTIAGENVSQMKINLALADSASYGAETLSTIRANLGADYVVLGSYIALGGGQIRLDVRLQDAVAGETLTAISDKANETQIDEIVGRTGSALREKLGIGAVQASDAAAVKAMRPSNLEAVRLYTEGLAKLRVFDALAARDLLEKAVTADPEHALAHSALAAAWSSLGYDARAKAEARRAFELSGSLSREERLAVEGRYREMMREHDKALEIYRTLWVFFPDNLDYGLRLTEAQIAAGKGRDAQSTLEAIRTSQPATGDPRIDLLESHVAASLSDFKRSREAAERAAAGGSLQGARLLVAQAQLSEARALHRLAELERAIAVFESAKEVFTAAGDRARAAYASVSIGAILVPQGKVSAAEEMYKETMSVQREIGDKRGLAASVNALGVIHSYRRDFPAARKFLEESLKIRREIDDRAGVAVSLNNIGFMLLAAGDPSAAKTAHEEALAIRRALADKHGIAQSLSNIGEALVGLIDLPGAMRAYEEALALSREIGDKSMLAASLRHLGEVRLSQGDLLGAQGHLEESLAINVERGLKDGAAFSRWALAQVLNEQSKAAEAEPLAREAAEQFLAESVAELEAYARCTLAESLLIQEKFAQAQETIDRAKSILAASEDRLARLFLLRTTGRVAAALGDTAGAVKILETAVADARKLNRVEGELDARLTLGEIDMKSGDAVAGRARLAALEKEAAAKGFLLIADKARATAGQL